MGTPAQNQAWDFFAAQYEGFAQNLEGWAQRLGANQVAGNEIQQYAAAQRRGAANMRQLAQQVAANAQGVDPNSLIQIQQDWLREAQRFARIAQGLAGQDHALDAWAQDQTANVQRVQQDLQIIQQQWGQAFAAPQPQPAQVPQAPQVPQQQPPMPNEVGVIPNGIFRDQAEFNNMLAGIARRERLPFQAFRFDHRQDGLHIAVDQNVPADQQDRIRNYLDVQLRRRGYDPRMAGLPTPQTPAEEEFTKNLQKKVEAALSARIEKQINRVKGQEDYFDGIAKAHSRVSKVEEKRDKEVEKARARFERRTKNGPINWIAGRTRDGGREAEVRELERRENGIDTKYEGRLRTAQERDDNSAASQARDRATEKRIAIEQARDEQVERARGIIESGRAGAADTPEALRRLDATTLRGIQTQLRDAGVTMSLRDVQDAAQSAARAVTRDASRGAAR